MPSLKFKEGVQLTITKAINEILQGATLVFFRNGFDCIVTSGRDGQHKPQSKHYENAALDFRDFHIEPKLVSPLVKEIQQALGKDFDVVLESDHIHIEKDPK